MEHSMSLYNYQAYSITGYDQVDLHLGNQSIREDDNGSNSNKSFNMDGLFDGFKFGKILFLNDLKNIIDQAFKMIAKNNQTLTNDELKPSEITKVVENNAELLDAVERLIQENQELYTKGYNSLAQKTIKTNIVSERTKLIVLQENAHKAALQKVGMENFMDKDFKLIDNKDDLKFSNLKISPDDLLKKEDLKPRSNKAPSGLMLYRPIENDSVPSLMLYRPKNNNN